ncbi:MAG: cupin domain-containing protein [Spirochaetia bacterium]
MNGENTGMIEYNVDFKTKSWESPLHGVRFKKYVSAGKQVRLVEYTKDFMEPDWCLKGHTGYVIEGEIEIDFNGNIISYKAGDVIFIPAGEESKHKAKILSATAKVFLVEDV